MKRLTIEQQENPIAQGNYDDTFRDDPDITVKCPHCGAIWELIIIDPSDYNESPLYDWHTSDIKHAYTTREGNHKPVHKDYCYACAVEHAKLEDYKSFVEDSRQSDEFREWMVGL